MIISKYLNKKWLMCAFWFSAGIVTAIGVDSYIDSVPNAWSGSENTLTVLYERYSSEQPVRAVMTLYPADVALDVMSEGWKFIGYASGEGVAFEMCGIGPHPTLVQEGCD